MGFCTLQELYDRIPTLENSQRISEAGIQKLIAEKSAHIEAMLATQYRVPTESDNPKSWAILRGICIEIIRPSLSKTLGIAVKHNPVTGQSIPDYNAMEAEKTLMKIREGRYNLPDAVGCEDCAISFAGDYDTSQVKGIPEESY